MTTETVPAIAEGSTLLVVPARDAAVSWLNSFLAASRDPERPTLYRNLSLEFFETGVQLIGCDGTVLFCSWVPAAEDAAWPDIDEAPMRSIVVMDADGFGVGFMGTLLQVTSQKGHEHESLTITTARMDDSGTPSLGTEFMTERLSLSAVGQRIDLRLFEDAYPDWRKLNLGMEKHERVEGLTLAPRILGLLGKLKEVGAVDLNFHGKERSIAFVARGATRQVRGLLMPMKRPVEKVGE